MKKKTKRIFIIIGILGLWVILFQGTKLTEAKDPDYPTKPITFYIPWAAGGPHTAVARELLDATSKYLGQPFIIINKPGGGAMLGAMTVMNSKPDGYSLGFFSSTHVLTGPHVEETPYHDLSGFTLILKFMDQYQPLIIRGDAPYKTWREFIEWARKNPRAAKIALPGSKSQTPQGIVMAQVEQEEKVEFTYLTLPGSADSLSAILGGHINAEIMLLLPTRVQYLKEGRLRLLAWVVNSKLPGYENIPFLGDLYKNIVIVPSVGGVWGPKDLPEYVLRKLDDAFAKGVKEPRFIAAMEQFYYSASYMNRSEINKEIKELFPKAGEIVKKVRAEELRQNK